MPSKKNNAAFVREGTQARLRRMRHAKEEQGFETNPPRCDNCTSCRGQQTIRSNGKAQYIPALCTKGQFPVKPTSICDEWTGHDGSVIG